MQKLETNSMVMAPPKKPINECLNEFAKEESFKNPFSEGRKESKKGEESVHDEQKTSSIQNQESGSRDCVDNSVTRWRMGYGQEGASSTVPKKSEGTVERECSSGRERLKRHRVEMAGRVWIPEMWGQEDLLKDWIDCTAFDSSLVGSSIMSARAALMEEGRRTNSTRLRIENSC